MVDLEGSQVEGVHLDPRSREHPGEVAVNKEVGLQKEIQWAMVSVCALRSAMTNRAT